MPKSNPKYRVLDGDLIVGKGSSKATAKNQAVKNYSGLTGIKLLIQKLNPKTGEYENLELFTTR